MAEKSKPKRTPRKKSAKKAATKKTAAKKAAVKKAATKPTRKTARKTVKRKSKPKTDPPARTPAPAPPRSKTSEHDALEARLTSPQFPYLCPGERSPITRAVCIGRQERNYERCLRCKHAIRDRRPRRRDFEET